MLRELNKDDISLILDVFSDKTTFATAKRKTGLPQNILSPIIEELLFFKLLIRNGSYLYQTDSFNRHIWETYDRNLDYLKFYKSDKAKEIHGERGINAEEVPNYKTFNFNEVIDEEVTEDDEIYTFCGSE